MLRQPSNQRQYDMCFSGDPALVQAPAAPPKEASAEEITKYKTALDEHLSKLRIARETGKWTELVIENEQPTKFVMQPIAAMLFRKLVDLAAGGEMGPGEMNAIAFRAAIVSIENFGGYKLRLVRDATYGTIAHEEVVELLDLLDLRIVSELGKEALQRANGPSPL